MTDNSNNVKSPEELRREAYLIALKGYSIVPTVDHIKELVLEIELLRSIHQYQQKKYKDVFIQFDLLEKELEIDE